MHHDDGIDRPNDNAFLLSNRRPRRGRGSSQTFHRKPIALPVQRTGSCLRGWFFDNRTAGNGIELNSMESRPLRRRLSALFATAKRFLNPCSHFFVRSIGRGDGHGRLVFGRQRSRLRVGVRVLRRFEKGRQPRVSQEHGIAGSAIRVLI